MRKMCPVPSPLPEGSPNMATFILDKQMTKQPAPLLQRNYWTDDLVQQPVQSLTC